MLPGVGFFPLSCVCRTYGNPLRVSAAPAGGKSWTCASNSSGAEIPMNAVEKAKSQLLIRIDARIIFFKNCTYLAPPRTAGYNRLVARGIIAGSKRPFSSHTAPFCGHIAGLYSHKKPSRGKKMTLFSHLADPSQQV